MQVMHTDEQKAAVMAALEIGASPQGVAKAAAAGYLGMEPPFKITAAQVEAVPAQLEAEQEERRKQRNRERQRGYDRKRRSGTPAARYARAWRRRQKQAECELEVERKADRERAAEARSEPKPERPADDHAELVAELQAKVDEHERTEQDRERRAAELRAIQAGTPRVPSS
jgi:hypothetical protein